MRCSGGLLVVGRSVAKSVQRLSLHEIVCIQNMYYMSNNEMMVCSVYVRVRPLNDGEREHGTVGVHEQGVWRADGNSIQQCVDAQNGKTLEDGSGPVYTLDTVFDGGCSTEQVYQQTTKSLVEQVLSGFNSTVFAYGQTSSGKTHTMKGSSDDPGIIPRAVQEIFESIETNTERDFLLRVSYMEVGSDGM